MHIKKKRNFACPAFAKKFHYDGDDLGAVWSPENTVFRLWTPTAAAAWLNLYEHGEAGKGKATRRVMRKSAKGTWTCTVEGDLRGRFYTYTVDVDGKEREAVDPYAKAVGVNGMRGMVVDLGQTDPPGWEADARPPFTHQTDAIIYELHVRDFSIDPASGLQNAGKYLAFTENGATLHGKGTVKTGVDHLVELGVTHLHLLPVYDFYTVDESKPDTPQYNWGYDPQNYNVPEGSYATNPFCGATRITEFKKMVQALHRNGIRVVMDVVYNHTGRTEDSNLNLLVPGYYYRQNEQGGFADGSGCGNETASERCMVRKMMIDSVVYWAKEYHIDGFRFDLMGLHDIETMNMIRAALDKIDPSIIMYGEGWTCNSSPLPPEKAALKHNTRLMDPRIAAFSDDMRDGVKGSVFDFRQPGFVNGEPSEKHKVMFGITASVPHPQTGMEPWAGEPSQSVAYASAHDNHTLWDKLRLSTSEGTPEDALVAMNKLAAAMVLTAQGLAFIHAGEELARSKPIDGGLDENSYKSSDETNKIRWERKVEYEGLFAYYKGLIALRKAHPAFRLRSAAEIAEKLVFLEDTAPEVLAFTLNGHAGGDRAETIAVLFNTADCSMDVKLPYSGWDIYVNGEQAGTEPLGRVEGDTLMAAPKSAYVLMRNVK